MKVHIQKNTMDISISFEQKENLTQLLEEVVSLHSFSYSTLAEAKKTVRVGDIEYCFDALSLCLYHSNLQPHLYSEFKRMLSHFYKRKDDREIQKERDERTTLFQYLTTGSCPYRDYRINKETRPDFVLEGKGQRIGIEVVELTTPYDQVLFSILKEHYGQGKTVSEIKAAAEQRHGRKAQNYDYRDIGGSVCIGSDLFSTREKQKHFAYQLYEKFKKYQTEIPSFDKFIVLGDAVRGLDISISDEYDVNNIFEWLEVAPDLEHVSFVILWLNNYDTEISASQFEVV